VEATPDGGDSLSLWAPEKGSSRADQRVGEWTTEPAPASAASPQGAAVAAYFAEIESYEQQAKYWSNPQELALSLVGQSAQGDTGGMRQLLETQRTAQRQIESMTVPLPCQEHHRRTVEMLGRAGELLERLEGRLASGDIEGLLSLSSEARQLETDTREVDALAGQIKRQFGLAG